MLVALAALCSGTAVAEDASDGRALLEKNCGRCHAVAADAKSPVRKAPNLWSVLRVYPVERLDVELAEGIGSSHPTMPQIQFTDEDITAIYYYLHPEARAE